MTNLTQREQEILEELKIKYPDRIKFPLIHLKSLAMYDAQREANGKQRVY